ncbi:hypothetical protein BJY59DRAFT_263080 [Rhodotorula toruloides]
MLDVRPLSSLLSALRRIRRASQGCLTRLARRWSPGEEGERRSSRSFSLLPPPAPPLALLHQLDPRTTPTFTVPTPLALPPASSPAPAHAYKRATSWNPPTEPPEARSSPNRFLRLGSLCVRNSLASRPSSSREEVDRGIARSFPSLEATIRDGLPAPLSCVSE